MKKEIHPQYQYVTVKCTNCGATFVIGTTRTSDFQVPICSKCHPAYTGKQLELSKVDRIARFMERVKKAEELRSKKEKNGER